MAKNITFKEIAKCIVLNSRGEVLLLKRGMSAPRRPGEWDFPGGIVDQDENHENAALRELKEEAGIAVTEAVLFYASTKFDENNVNVCLFYYLVDLENESEVRISWEHDEFKWASLEDAIGYITYVPQKQALQHLKDYIV